MKRRVINVLLAMLMLIFVAGCNKETEKTVEKEDVQEEAATEEAEAEAPGEKKEKLPESLSGSSVAILDDMAYYMGNGVIMSLNTKTGESEIIWQDDRVAITSDSFTGGVGLILNGKLYFTSLIQIESEGIDYITEELLFNVMDLSDGSVEEIAVYTGEHGSGGLYYADGILYVHGDKEHNCFYVDKKGNIADAADIADIDSMVQVPDDYYIGTFTNNGTQSFVPVRTLQNSNRIVLNTDYYETVLYDVSTKREISLGGSAVSMNKDKILVVEYDDGNSILGTIDIKSGEYTFLLKSEDYFPVFAMDDKYAYYTESPDRGQRVVYRTIDLSTGKLGTVFEDNRIDAAPYYVSTMFNTTYENGKIYYLTSMDCELKFAVYDIKTGNNTVANSSFYDTGISRVGALKYYGDNVELDDGTLLGYASVTMLKVDNNYKGAAAINHILDSKAREIVSDFMALEPEMTERYEEVAEYGYYSAYFTEYAVKELDYFDGRYLGFEMSGYEYYGGAHGLPYIYGYVFDMETGNRLTLRDLVNVSEAELKQAVTEHFEALMEQNGTDNYWDDAASQVYSTISLDSDNFSLKEDGIEFQFTPYEVAPYVMGHQIVRVPFDELGIELN